uniref:Uncharacterized protein n=1 Tax=Cairina moschata TaxID=8855 RepID=A0A8C3BKL0_CAIMO
MAARSEAALLLLLLLGGVLPPARSCPGTPGAGGGAGASPEPPPETPGPAALGALLRSLQRPGRSPAPLLQPPRFPRGPGALARLSPRSWDPPTAPFWTMATPQRFGRRR